jgi:hypothetical protein
MRISNGPVEQQRGVEIGHRDGEAVDLVEERGHFD